ncbi:MAG: thiamine pyrophosphate-binding protein, partial [Solirubrobacteraceae bacterium]
MESFTAAEVVGRTLVALGVRDAFGVLGSGNFIATQALHAAGAAFHHARHEGGAICMADGYARVSGRVGVCSVHQGPGFTNAMTGLTEAAKSRTPLLLLAGEAPAAALRSNFRLDQAALATTVGAAAERVHSGASAADDVARALRIHITQSANGAWNYERIFPREGGAPGDTSSGLGDWINVHNKWGGGAPSKAQETTAGREQRILASRAGGMLRPSTDIYAVAANCFECHTVPVEDLVN